MINPNRSSIPNRTSIKILENSRKGSCKEQIQPFQQTLPAMIPKKTFGRKIASDQLMSRRTTNQWYQKSAPQLEEVDNIEEVREIVRKKKDFSVVRKRREIDTLVAVASIFILYCLAIHLAPFQFYSPLQQ